MTRLLPARRTRIAWRLVPIFLLASAACAAGEAAQSGTDAPEKRSGTNSKQTTNGIAIGVALDPKRPGMQSIYNGVELAIEQANTGRKGGTPFVMRRAAAHITSAVQIASDLRSDPGVVGVVGHPESGTTSDALPIYSDTRNGGKNAVVAVSPTATSPALSGASPWFFRVCPTDTEASQAVAHYVMDSLGARRAAVIYRNDSYGRDWTKSFASAYRVAGGTLVQRDPYVTGGATEWEAYAGYMKQLGAEVLLFPGSVGDAELAIRAVRATGSDIPFIGGDAASGLEDKADEFAGARYTAFFDARIADSPAARSFIERYQKKYGSLPDQRAALAYDAALVITTAAAAVGNDRKKVRAYIAEIGRTRPALEGVAGRIAFDKHNDVVGRPVVIATVGG